MLTSVLVIYRLTLEGVMYTAFFVLVKIVAILSVILAAFFTYIFFVIMEEESDGPKEKIYKPIIWVLFIITLLCVWL